MNVRHNRFRSPGFTLIEILVVAAILAFALAVVPPFLPNVFPELQLRSAARDLAAALRQARGRAIVSREPVAVTVDVEHRSFARGEEDRRLRLPGHATLTLTAADSERVSDNAGAIRFFPDGSSTGGRVELKLEELSYTVDVAWLTGNVTISP